MKKGWSHHVLFLVFLGGLLITDRVLTYFVSPMELIASKGGVFSIVDKHFSFVNEIRARELALRKIDDESDPNAQLKQRYALAKKYLSAAEEERKQGKGFNVQQEYRQFLENLVQKHQNQPAVLDGVVTLLKFYEAEKDYSEAKKLIQQFTRLGAHPNTPDEYSLKMYMTIASAVTDPSLFQEKLRMLKRAALRHNENLALFEVLFRACAAADEVGTPFAEGVRARIKEMRTLRQVKISMDFQLKQLANLMSEQTIHIATEEANLFRENLTDPILVLEFEAGYCALLDKSKLMDHEQDRLFAMLKLQEAALPDTKVGLSTKTGVKLIMEGFVRARAARNLSVMITARNLAEVFAPAYLPWLDTQLWVARGMSESPAVEVVDVPLISEPNMTWDGEANEAAWAQAGVFKGPYYHYPRVNDPKVWDQKSLMNPDVRVFHDGKATYFFLHLPEPKPAEMHVEHDDGVVDIWRDESVEFFFFPKRNFFDYTQIIMNANGKWIINAVTTQYFVNDHVEPGMPGKPLIPEGGNVAAGRDGTGWTLEFMIPNDQIGFSDEEKTSLDGFAFRRNRYVDSKKGQCEAWSLTKCVDTTNYQQTQMILKRIGVNPEIDEPVLTLEVPEPTPEVESGDGGAESEFEDASGAADGVAAPVPGVEADTSVPASSPTVNSEASMRGEAAATVSPLRDTTHTPSDVE